MANAVFHRTFRALSVALLFWLGGCSDVVSNAEPPRSEDTIVLSERSSSVVVPVSAPMAALQKRLNDDIPRTLYAINEGRDACVPAQWAVVCLVPNIFGGGCAVPETRTIVTPAIDCHIRAEVARGDIRLGGQGDTLTMSMPVRLNALVTGRGEIGRHINIPINGAADVSAAVSAGIGEDWQPTATIATNFNWSDPIGIDILPGWRITFSDQVNPNIREALDAFQRDMPAKLADLKVKEQAEAAWKRGFATIQLSENPKAWVRFAPERIGYSGYTVSGDTLSLKFMAQAKTETFLGARPADVTPAPLPILSRQLPEGRFNFYLPILADYAEMETAARRALKVGEEQTFDVPEIGKVRATFTDVRVHQTAGNALAVGISLKAAAPSSFFDTRGTVWLVAAVSVDNEARKVVPVKFDLYGNTDNAAFNLLAAITRLGPVNDALRASLTYDFAKQHEEALRKANAALKHQLSDDLYFTGTIEKANVDKAVATPQGFYVGLEVTGAGAVQYGKLVDGANTQ